MRTFAVLTCRRVQQAFVSDRNGLCLQMLNYQAQAVLGNKLPPADALSAATHVALALCNVADSSFNTSVLGDIGPLIKKVGPLSCCEILN